MNAMRWVCFGGRMILSETKFERFLAAFAGFIHLVSTLTVPNFFCR